MRVWACCCLAAALAATTVCVPHEQRLVHRLTTQEERLSYALGVDLGARYRRIGAELDLQALAQGIADTVRGAPLKVDTAHIRALKRAFVKAAFVRRNSDSAAAAVPVLSLDKLDTLLTERQRNNYVEGLDVGAGLLRCSVDVRLPCLVQGMADTMYGMGVLLKAEELSGWLTTLAETVKARGQRETGARLEALRRREKRLVEENAARTGVTVCTSGLQYSVVKPGRGARPTPKSRVLVHFVSRLADSTLIEDSHTFKGPALWEVGGMSQGLVEGVCLMKPGAVYRFVVPPELGFGAESHTKIPPNSVVLYEVELLKVL